MTNKFKVKRIKIKTTKASATQKKNFQKATGVDYDLRVKNLNSGATEW